MLIPDDLDMELDEFVERYEMAHATQSSVDLADYMPSQQHPRYAQIACELLRVHMELSASAGHFVSAEDCRKRYPSVCEQSVFFKALQAEEERVRISSRAIASAVAPSDAAILRAAHSPVQPIRTIATRACPSASRCPSRARKSAGSS